MSQVRAQVHTKFKVFTGSLAPDLTLGPLAEAVAAWATEHRVAPKSIGIEYLESARRIVLSLGYRDDEPGYGIALTSVSLGRVERLDAAAIAQLEQQMAAAAAEAGEVICHELYVTEDQSFLMVFMTHRG